MTLVAFLVLLGVLITVHELGHFLTAKACGVKVLTFSIGFGPKLFSVVRGETEYRIAIIPLGGYVRMYGDDINEEVPDSEKHRAFLEKPTAQKMAIAFAGPAANMLLALAVFFGLSLGDERVLLPVVGTVLAGEPAEEADLREGDRITSANGTAVESFDDLVKIIGPRAGQETPLVVERPDAGTVTLSVTPRASTDGVGRIGMLPGKITPVVVVTEGSTAHKAGMRTKDRVLAFESGHPLSTYDHFRWVLKRSTYKAQTLTVERVDDAGNKSTIPISLPAEGLWYRAPDHSEFDTPEPKLMRYAVVDDELSSMFVVIERTKGLTVTAQRAALPYGIASIDGLVSAIAPGSAAAEGGVQAQHHRVVAVDGEPLRIAQDLATALSKDKDKPHVIGLVDVTGEASVFVFRMKDGVLGVSLQSAIGDAATEMRSRTLAQSAVQGVTSTIDAVKAIIDGYVQLFTGRVGLDQLGGPVMLAQIAGEAARSGVEVFLGTMALLSINLGVLNLLPVPVLDGGHILLFTIEAVRRKRLSIEARVRALKVGIVFVGLLMATAIFNDLRRVITDWLA